MLKRLPLRTFASVALGAMATTKFLATFKDFPPRQRAPSFSVDQAVEKMKQNLSND